MIRTRFLAAGMAVLCLAALPAAAAEVDCDSVYCFSSEDFSEGNTIKGICITDLPSTGSILLGDRILRPGDILTAEQTDQMTFSPHRSESDHTAEVHYLPISHDAVESEAVLTISIRGKEDKIPVAEDSAAETYKNLHVTGKLKVSDPEGQSMTFTVTRQPKRGTLEISNDGTFTYTPKKNKVGVDSFTYTATDPAGKISREATVTITILKPTDATQYTDTMGKDCRFAAEWMRHTGIFTGEQLAGKPCFNPDKEVTRGEFLTMLVKALDIPAEEEATLTHYTDEIPQWLHPYLAAAVRSGLTAGLPEQEVFGADTPITGAEAAVMLQNALDLAVSRQEETASDMETTLPVWAEASLSALSDGGLNLDGETILTRGETAQILYQAVQISSKPSFME